MRDWNSLYKTQDNKLKYVWSKDASDFLLAEIPFFIKQNYNEVLVLGCGGGRNMEPLIKEGFSVVGVDISEEALQLANDNLSDYNKSSFSLVKQDLNDLSFENKFDVIFSAKTFKHLWNTEKIINSLYPLLSENGVVLLEFASLEDSSYQKCLVDAERVEGNRFLHKSGIPYRFHSKEELERIFSKFSDVKISKVEYWDEPHNELSSKPHKHISWIIKAGK